MMKRLEGRSLAHPGCMMGIVAGLIIGIVLGGVLASAYNVTLGTILWIWLGLTIGLAIIGWIIGERLSTRFRFPKLVEDQAPTETSSTAQTPLHPDA
ncbi:MAG: hypothetical protein M3Z24_09055 [Chloroflexota bacterium]|nr:hypothetical protein [Chloroflexota bacterium]